MRGKLIIAFLATLGVLDTAFLTYEHYSNFIPPCSTHFSLINCGEVLRSQYSVIFGVPLSLFGLLYYFAVLTIIFLAIQTREKLWNKLLLPLATFGLITSAYLLYLQLVVIKNICPYCTASGIINLLVFVTILTKASQPTNNNPMQKRGFAPLIIVAIIAVVLAAAGAGAYYFYSKSQPSPYPTNNNQPAPSTNGQPAMSASNDTSNQGLDQDTNTINQQFNSLNNDSASVNQSFNDQPVNLQ